MLVRDLIARLSEIDPDLEVIAEGCDCSNPVDDVVVEPASAYEDRTYAAYCLLAITLGRNND